MANNQSRNPEKLSTFATLAIATLSSLTTILVALISSGQIHRATERVANQTAIVGEIRAFAGETKPSGWMECAGQSLEISKYKPLHEAIGGHWGSSDSEHFNVPDLRGMFLRGWNDGKSENDPNLSPEAKSTQWLDDGAGKRLVLLRNGISGDHVGSYQADRVGPHSHWVANGMSIPSSNNGYLEYTSNPDYAAHSHYTDSAKEVKDGLLNQETAPKNASVLFAIYVGNSE